MSISICKFLVNYACNFFSHHAFSWGRMLPLKSFKLRTQYLKNYRFTKLNPRTNSIWKCCRFSNSPTCPVCGKARECFAQMEQEPLLVSVIACDVNQAEHSLPRQCWKGRTLFLISVNFYWERFYKLRPFFHSCLPSYDFNTLKLVLDWFTHLDSKVSLNSDDSNFIIFMIPVHVFKEFFNTFESENMRDLFQATRRWNTVKFAQVVHLIFVQITE